MHAAQKKYHYGGDYILTYNDFVAAPDKVAFILQAIAEHKASTRAKIAKDAHLYYRQLNTEIMSYKKYIRNLRGGKQEDFFAANNKVASNFFQQFVDQEVQYLLSNGVNISDSAKTKIDRDLDTMLQNAAVEALIGGVAFCFYNVDRVEVFKLTEFAPLYDERTGTLMAGIRYIRIDADKPEYITLYEPDGVTEYKHTCDGVVTLYAPKRRYRQTIFTDSTRDVLGESDYNGVLPIIPLYGNKNKDSELVGCKNAIDLYDRVLSDFGNDLDRNSVIYWIVKNCGGMTDDDLYNLQAKLKTLQIVDVDADSGGGIEPHTIDVPTDARKTILEILEKRLYKDYGALNTDSLSAAATATQIKTAYLPLDEKVDGLEYCILEFLRKLFALAGVSGETPTFSRSRLLNDMEQTEAVMMAAQYLDEETLLRKLPFIQPDEVETIMSRVSTEEQGKFVRETTEPTGEV